MPARVIQKDLNEVASSASQGTPPGAYGEESSEVSFSSASPILDKPLAPSSHGTPAAGSVHLDIPSSDATEDYDDQFRAEGEMDVKAAKRDKVNIKDIDGDKVNYTDKTPLEKTRVHSLDPDSSLHAVSSNSVHSASGAPPGNSVVHSMHATPTPTNPFGNATDPTSTAAGAPKAPPHKKELIAHAAMPATALPTTSTTTPTTTPTVTAATAAAAATNTHTHARAHGCSIP